MAENAWVAEVTNPVGGVMGPYLKLEKGAHLVFPIVSMYGIFSCIYHENQANVGIYTSPMDPMAFSFTVHLLIKFLSDRGRVFLPACRGMVSCCHWAHEEQDSGCAHWERGAGVNCCWRNGHVYYKVGPLPVITGVVTPISRIITPVTYL